MNRKEGTFGLRERWIKRCLGFALLSFMASADLRADRVSYSGVHEVTAKQGALTFHHVHDWSSPKVSSLFLDTVHHERFFSNANDFSYVELREGRKVLFRSPSPALTHLWISPEGRYLVGLSSVRLRNPYQLVVWRRDGTLLHREHISAQVAKVSPEQRRELARRFPKVEQWLAGRYFTVAGSTYVDYFFLGDPREAAWKFLFPLRVQHPYSVDFSESVTNWIDWFDAENPELAIEPNGRELVLSLRSPSGKRMSIRWAV